MRINERRYTHGCLQGVGRTVRIFKKFQSTSFYSTTFMFDSGHKTTICTALPMISENGTGSSSTQHRYRGRVALVTGLHFFLEINAGGIPLEHHSTKLHLVPICKRAVTFAGQTYMEASSQNGTKPHNMCEIRMKNVKQYHFHHMQKFSISNIWKAVTNGTDTLEDNIFQFVLCLYRRKQGYLHFFQFH